MCSTNTYCRFISRDLVRMEKSLRFTMLLSFLFSTYTFLRICLTSLGYAPSLSPAAMGITNNSLKRCCESKCECLTQSTMHQYSKRLFCKGDPVSAMRRFVRILLNV